MWPLPKIEHSIVTFSFASDYLLCTIIEKIATIPFLSMSATTKYWYSDLTIAHQTVCNPTRIKQIISSFIAEHKKHNALIIFSLSDANITEKYVTLPADNPTITDFGYSPSSHYVTGHRLMYHNHHGQAVFYFYRISHAVILQYQLIALSLRLNLINITTDHTALFYAYKNLVSQPFRQSQYALDMIETNNTIHKKIPLSSIKKAISLHENTLHDSTDIAIAYGLFVAQGTTL